MQDLNNKNLTKVIIVHNQKELDAIPEDYQGRIILQETIETVYISQKYDLDIYVGKNAFAVVKGDARVVARDNARVKADESLHIVACNNSIVVTHGNSNVVAYDNSSIVAWDNSSVEAWDNSSIVAYGNSIVQTYGNSRVKAKGNTQILDRTYSHKIEISSNAHIVYMPQGLQEFIKFYEIEVKNGIGTFYKAVRKTDEGIYYSSYDNNFTYEIGKEKEEPNINRDVSENCGEGIHICTLQFALHYGEGWEDLAILECQSKLEDIVCPENTNGKVRTSKVMVIREVPLEECGVYGKMIAKKLKRRKS